MSLDQFTAICGAIAEEAPALLYTAALFGALVLLFVRGARQAEELMALTDYRKLALGDAKQNEMENDQPPVNYDLPTWLRQGSPAAHQEWDFDPIMANTYLRPQAQVITKDMPQ